MDDTWYPTQDVQTDVDQQIRTAASPDEDWDKGKPDRDEVEENVATAGLCARHYDFEIRLLKISMSWFEIPMLFE